MRFSCFWRLAAAGCLAGSLACAQTRAWRELAHGLVSPPAGATGPLPGNLQGLAYGNGIYVASTRALAESGSIATSLDGVTWTPRPLTVTAESAGPVQFFNGRFFLQSLHAGTPRTHFSVDGINWQHLPANVPARGQGYATDGLRILGFADNYLALSEDGINWRPTNLPPGAGYALAHDGARFVGSNGAAHTSTDGSTWTPLAAAPPALKAIHIAGGTWLMYSRDPVGVYTSSDNGATFRPHPGNVSPNADRLTWVANGRFFQFGDGRIHGSRDGLAWTGFGEIPGAVRLAAVHNVVYLNGRYFALGGRAGPPSPAVLLALDADPTDVPPVIVGQPASATVAAGGAAVLAVRAAGATAYQWRRNGTDLPGQTAATLLVTNATPDHAGTYSALVRGLGGDVNSNGARLDVVTVPAAEAGRIVNLSVLTDLEAAESAMTLGFVVAGAGTTGSKPILVRAVGPSLAAFGVAGAHTDPVLELYSGPLRLAQNDNWSGASDLAEVSARVGAFPFASAASRDAALFAPSLARGDTSARITGPASAGGTILAEVYDASRAAEFTATTPRLVNVSAAKAVPAAGSLSAGFSLGGQTATTVLVRVVGPALAQFGLAGMMENPQLALFRQGQSTPLAANDDWSDDLTLAAIMRRVGAFAFPEGSKDAALLLTLPAGSYSVVASGVNGGGQALVEIYEVR